MQKSNVKQKSREQKNLFHASRGLKAMLPHGGLPEIISPYMVDLISKNGGVDGPLGKQFVAQPAKEKRLAKTNNLDPLSEDEHEVAPGLIYKYEGKLKKGKVITYGRVLWTVTRFCATYCRFCTRGREIGIPAGSCGKTKGTIANNAFLTGEQINEVFKFIKEHKEINEIILSGGDPLVAPKDYLIKIITGLSKLQEQGYLDVVRIGSRLPIVNPTAIQEWHYELLGKIKNLNLMVHINHPSELTQQSVDVLYNFRKKSLATVFSQTVLLKGVNDNVETLYQLFIKMVKEGIRPYYMYQNDPVYWANHFTVPFKRAVAIWEKLRPRLSGIAATARFVIDTPHGYGKIPVPEGSAWKVNYNSFIDFKKKKHIIK